MRNRLLFVALLSFLWILLGSWFVGTYMSPKTVNIPDLVFEDEGTKFASSDHLWFKAGGDELELGHSTKEMLGNVAAYLHNHPNRKVTIFGCYLKEELNTSEYENLGLARAEALRQYLENIGLPAPQMETNFEELVENPMIEGVFYDAIRFSFDDIFHENPEEFPGEDAPVAKEEIEPLVIYGEAIDQLIMNPSLMHFIEQIKAYLVEHPDQKLKVIGHSEQTDDIDKTIARSKASATKVRSFLRKHGIKSANLSWEGRGAADILVGPGNPKASTRNNRVEIRLDEN